MHHNPHERGDRPSGRDGVNVLYLLANCYATCFTVFLRTNFGAEALGVHGVGAVLLILLAAGGSGTPDPFLAFLAAWFCALVVQRARTVQNARTGHVEHSRYAGFPAVTLKLLPFVKSEMRAKAIEPVLCMVVGCVLGAVWPALGGFIFFGAFALTIVRAIDMRVNQVRVQKMRDAEIEHRQLAMRYSGELDEF